MKYSRYKKRGSDVADVNMVFMHAVGLCPHSHATYMNVRRARMIIILTVRSKDCGRRMRDLNSSSACLAQMPAVVFSASTSLLRRMRSRIRFLS